MTAEMYSTAQPIDAERLFKDLIPPWRSSVTPSVLVFCTFPV